MNEKEDLNQNTSREHFSSRLGMILATVGFAAGVGNLWRFPYIVGSNGGGVFLIFYILIVLFVGIPLLTAEFAMGAKAEKNPIDTYKVLTPNKKWQFNGYIHLLAIILLIGYTTPVYAWILYYIFHTAIGTFQGMDPNQVGATFDSLTGDHTTLFFWAGVNVVFILLVVRNKLQNGIEKICKIMLPCLGIIMIALSIKGLTLPGASKGIKYYLTPDFSQFNIESALTGVSQAFFSIGIAMAVGMVFAGYMKEKEKDKLASSAATVACLDTLVAFVAGFMIFPSVFAFGLDPSSGAGLTFVTMPNVFNNLGGGRIWGTLFYLGFYFAAFTSVVSGWEVPINFFREKFNMSRGKAVLASLVVIMIVTIPSVWSMDIFNKMDYIENNFLLVFGGLIMTIYVGWIWGIDNFLEAARIKNSTLRIIYKILIKFVDPIVIIILILYQFNII